MNPPSLSALFIERLGWQLVHSVWQFLLIAVVAFLCHRALRMASANARYTVLLAALAAMTLAPVTTWLLLPDLQSTAMFDAVSVRERTDSPGRRPASVAEAVPLDETVFNAHEPLPGSVVSSHASAPRPVEPDLARLLREQRLEDHLRPWFPVIVGFWCLGVVTFALRPALSWFTVRRLKSTGVPVVVPTIRELLQRTAERLKIRSHLTILQSALVQTPMVVGYLRPVILLPVRVVTGLPTSQLEAILAHELAHVRRHDYLFNLLQTVIETLFFYHPAVWWISAKLREERENCCDDVAVALLGNRLEYGRALLALEEQRALSTALTVSWGGGSLLDRTRRLLTPESTDRSPATAAILTLVLLPVAVVVAGVWATAQEGGARSTGKEQVIAADETDKESSDSSSTEDETSLIIEGTLIQEETGRPVVGATIACGAFINATNGGGANAVTDSTGRFRLVAPSAGIYNVWVKSHTTGRHLMAAADDGVRVIPGRPARSDLRLVAGRRVTGRLLDPAGQPVAGASLGCSSPAHPQSSGGVETSKTDANGEFEFLVPPGRARIHVMNSPAGGGRLTAEISLEVDREANPEPVELTLVNRQRPIGSPEWLSRSTPGTQILEQNRRGRDIVGTVVDNEGRPLEGALVFPDTGPLSTTGPKGEFRVAVDRGTQLVLYAFHEGCHVWFGTPMAGDVLKVVLEQKVRPRAAGAAQTPEPSNVEDQDPTVKAPGPRDTAPSRNSRLIVRYDLPGAEEVANIVVTASGESVGSDSNGRLVTTPLKNGQQREFTDLPSGDLFVARSRIVEYVKVGSAPFSRPMLLDGRRFVLQAKDESLVEFTRPGARVLKGTVRGLRESGLDRALLFICSPEIRDARAAQFVNDGGPGVLFDVRHCDADGSFQTEPLSPGDYTVIAAGYVDLPENEKYRLPELEPRYAAIARVTIPKVGEVESIALILADTRTLDRPVTISGDGIPLEEALRVMCERAGLRLELDRDALLNAGLDLEERMTLNINNQPLGEVLADLIPWQDYPGVLREVRNGQLRITTLEAAQTRIRERLPEWLKPLYANGLLATLNDSGEVVTISASRIVDDAFLERLESLPQLRELSFEVTEGVTADGLECLTKLPALEGLSLYDVNLGGDGLGDDVLEVASRIATLKRLSLVHCGVTDAGLQHLEGMRQLTELGLSQNPITDAGLKSLAGLVELRTLSLAGFSSAHYERTQITDAGMAHLVNLKSLQSLEITGQMVSGRFLDFPRLQSLSIGGPAIDNAAGEQIARLRELRQLSLVYTEMTNAGLETIGHLPRLEHLNIDSSRITDAGIAHLRGLANLQSFTLRATGVGDESLRYLAEIKSLERLDLYGSGEPGVHIGRRFSIEGLCQLKALPELRQLSLTNFAADGGFAGLAELQQLRQLNLMMTDIRSDEIELLGAELPDTRIQAVSGSGGVLPKRGRRQVR